MARVVYGSGARSSLVMAQFIYGEKLTDNLTYYQHARLHDDGDVDDYAQDDDIDDDDKNAYDDDDDKNIYCRSLLTIISLRRHRGGAAAKQCRLPCQCLFVCLRQKKNTKIY